jgi:DNA-directed RNA polymerase beta' subunit
MLSSFEKTTEVLYDSALFNLKDPLKGVSEAIIVGKRVPLGTNSFDLMLDL